MGPLLLTGFALFGAIAGIGLVGQNAEKSPASGGAVSPARRLALILIAFAAGCGVLGVVEGLIAITQGVIGDSPPAVIVPVLAIGGAAVGLLPVVRNATGLDPWVTSKTVFFGGNLVALAIVVALLAGVIHSRSNGSPSAWPFALLGVISAGGAIGLGLVGGAWVRRVAAAQDEVAVALVSTAVTRVLPFEIAGYVGSLLGIALVITT